MYSSWLAKVSDRPLPHRNPNTLLGAAGMPSTPHEKDWNVVCLTVLKVCRVCSSICPHLLNQSTNMDTNCSVELSGDMKINSCQNKMFSFFILTVFNDFLECVKSSLIRIPLIQIFNSLYSLIEAGYCVKNITKFLRARNYNHEIFKSRVQVIKYVKIRVLNFYCSFYLYVNTKPWVCP